MPGGHRIAFAAAHVVADPAVQHRPGQPAQLDWAATLAFRHHLWDQGLGVAEAMDTAQRGSGLDWPAARELITRTGSEAAAVAGRLACGAGTDQLPGACCLWQAPHGPGEHGPPYSLAAIRGAYAEQMEAVEQAGGQIVLLASRALATAARGPEDYHAVYSPLLYQASQPVILHWLGPVFDPMLSGYWGSPDPDEATANLLTLIAAHPARVDGVKLSLLDEERERAFRAALPSGVRLYTGDDYHYLPLIRGDDTGHSDALLGILDPLAVPAGAALTALAAGDLRRYDELLAPTVPLARELFADPVPHYKTGIVFLAWLTGHQDRFVMLAGAHRHRTARQLAGLLPLAEAAGILPDPEQAAWRLREYLAGGQARA